MIGTWSGPAPSAFLPVYVSPGYFPVDAFETPAADFAPIEEKRKEMRYQTCENVRVSLLDTPGLEVPGILRDVSKNGLRVELALPVKEGALVKVAIRNKAIVFALARHCRRTLDTYQVGASIESLYCPAIVQKEENPSVNSGNRTAPVCTLQTESGTQARECRDLARAIIDDHTLFASAIRTRLAEMPPVSDRVA
jgi:hypothetical protein